MVIKDFITDQQLNEILNWISVLDPVKRGIDPNFAKIETIPNAPKCLDDIKNKCLNSNKRIKYIKSEESDFILDVPPETTVWMHIDGSRKGYKFIRFIILLQKPDKGGELIFIDQNIKFNIKDCYVLDSTLLHGMTKVEGSKNYLSIVFSYDVKEEND